MEVGCDWAHDGEMFLQTENASAQARSWGWTFLTPVRTVEDRGWPHYSWMPDGHISSLKVSRTVEDVYNVVNKAFMTVDNE